jgi:hypothetical protein
MKRTGHAVLKEEMRILHTVLAGATKRKTSLGKHKRKWEDNIKVIINKQSLTMLIKLKWLRMRSGGWLFSTR